MKQLFFVLLLCPVLLFAQSKSGKTLEIKTSAQCSECKERIEKDFAFEKGVSSAVLNLDTKVLTVVYNEKKTNPETLKKRVTLIGYDADDVPANQKAYAKLPYCCQKTETHSDSTKPAKGH